MMLASRHGRPCWSGSSGMPCCRPAPRSARIAPRIRRISRASLETRAPTFRPSCRTSAARPGPPKGDRKPHPICPRRSARPFACLLYGCVGCDAQPLACLDERLEPPADELGPALREPLDQLGFDGADRAERKLDARAAVAIAQLERGDAEGESQVKRPGQLQVAAVGPASHGSEDGASSIPTLDNEPAELWLESQTGGIRA